MGDKPFGLKLEGDAGEAPGGGDCAGIREEGGRPRGRDGGARRCVCLPEAQQRQVLWHRKFVNSSEQAPLVNYVML